MNSGSCLYIWTVHHLLLLAAYLAYRYRLISAVREEEGGVTYTRLYYTARKVFAILAASLIAYVFIVKWAMGWRIDNWWAEALLVLITIACGNLTFIAARNTDQFKDSYTRLKRPYIIFVLLFIWSFYARMVLAMLSVFSYNSSFADRMFPDIRYNDLYLFENYYLSYSDAKDIVVEKKVFIFSKDLTTLRTFKNSLCNFHGFDFTDEDEAVPFPFSTRTKNGLIVYTNPVQKKGYLDFEMDSGRVRISGYIYATTDAAIDATYMSCGVEYLK